MVAGNEAHLTILPQQTIKGYELKEMIGEGAFGAVYRAHQPVIDREVAVKVILPEYASRPDFIRRFESEAQLIAQLEHVLNRCKRLSGWQGIGNPARTISISKPTVFSATVLPPVFGPLITNTLLRSPK